MRPPASTSALCVNIDASRFFAVSAMSHARWGMYAGSVATKSAPTRSQAIAAKAPSNSPGPRASTSRSCNPQRLRGCLDVPYGERLRRTHGVGKDGYAADLGNSLPEQIQVFAENVRADAVGHPCEVSPRARAARDDAQPNGFGKTHSDDGDRSRRVPRCYGSRRWCRGDDIHFEFSRARVAPAGTPRGYGG